MGIPKSQTLPSAKKVGKPEPERERDVFVRFHDLKARGIVSNWPSLLRWIEREGFPPGFRLGSTVRAWRQSDVDAWIASRVIPSSGGEAA
jgi:hypothetical protein